MDDAPAEENPPADSNAAAPPPEKGPEGSGAAEPQGAFNKIDLSQLQGFSFGTQWTQDKSPPAERRGRGERAGAFEREGGAGPGRRDRRSFRRPNEAGGGPPEGGEGGGEEPRRGPERPPGGRPPPRGRGEPAPHRRATPREPAPYVSPDFTVAFYPDEASFGALVRTVRASCRTIELFEIAKTVLAKPERFAVVVTRRLPEGTDPAAKPPPIPVAVPDGLAFESEEAAVAHVLRRHLGLFFDRAEVAVDPPKGNFPVINRCTITGELLGPPNYHRYAQIVQRHHAERISRFSLEEYRASRIESVRDPELVQQWLERMKKVTRYTWKEPPAPEAAAAPPSGETAAPEAALAAAAAGTEPAPAAAPPAPPPSFDTLEEARAHLLAHARDRVVRLSGHARFPGRLVETLPHGEIRRAIEGALERQRRFPLDTANQLRGRLRREHFTIFKKGARGVSYVCAVKRRFRVPGQVFADSVGALIGFIEAHPMVKAADLADQLLGLGHPAPDAVLAPEQREKAARLQADLHWLVHEGYVTEFIDGSLYAAPPMVEARKREIEAEEQDPENFPEPAGSAEAQAPAEPQSAAEPEPQPEPAPVAEPPAAPGP